MSDLDCEYKVVCYFFLRKNQVHDAIYRTNLEKYCDGDVINCAIHQVIKGKNFLSVPKDLFPNQTFRVSQILGAKGGGQ